MKKLFEYYWEVGRMGRLEGLFIATQEEVDNAIGKHLSFGEVLGKHSDIEGELWKTEITVRSEDQDLIQKLEEIFEGRNISGYNPLDYLPEEEEEEEEGEETRNESENVGRVEAIRFEQEQSRQERTVECNGGNRNCGRL